MKQENVTLSNKYQIVIPKAARKTLGISHADGQKFVVTKVTGDKIIFSKVKKLDEYLGQYGDAFVANASKRLREQRDNDWQ